MFCLQATLALLLSVTDTHLHAISHCCSFSCAELPLYNASTLRFTSCYKTLQSFFESFHLFVDFPLGLTFISILRCHSSISFCISPSIHVTTRHRIAHICNLMHFTFCGHIKSVTVLSLTCRPKSIFKQAQMKKRQSFIFYLLPRNVFTQTHSWETDVHVYYIHKTSIFTSQRTHFFSIRNINLLMLETSAVCYVRKSQNT